MTAPSETSVQSAAVAAANWWAEAIQAPMFDNGDGMTSMLGAYVAALQPSVSPGNAQSFAEVLAGRIAAQLQRFADLDSSLCIGVDYGPDRLLAEAARDANVGNRQFPWKTMMWICPTHVTVSAGYGAPTVLVWGSGDWRASRPLCRSQKWDETRPYSPAYGGEPFQCSLPKYHDEAHCYDLPLALCASCGHPEDFWHSDERAHMPDFHEFAAGAVVTASRLDPWSQPPYRAPYQPRHAAARERRTSWLTAAVPVALAVTAGVAWLLWLWSR